MAYEKYFWAILTWEQLRITGMLQKSCFLDALKKIVCLTKFQNFELKGRTEDLFQKIWNFADVLVLVTHNFSALGSNATAILGFFDTL